MAELECLLTNDDGIDSPGFRALYDALSEFASVTAVAPASDRSSVGRSLSRSVVVEETDLGYAIDGTPADCVVAGMQALVPETDVVVAGCNEGANLGAYVLGRSGTVSAAVEAAFFDVPAIAVSMYIPADGDTDYRDVTVSSDRYRYAAHATRYLCEHTIGAGVFDRADYLNVNVPMAPETVEDDRPPMAITEPSTTYMMDAERRGEEVVLQDRIWELMASGDVPDPAGSDRRAVVDGKISVSPLTAPHTTEHHEALDALAETYPAVAE